MHTMKVDDEFRSAHEGYLLTMKVETGFMRIIIVSSIKRLAELGQKFSYKTLYKTT